MSSPYEWTINNIERDVNEVLRRFYGMDTIRNDVCRLEYTLRETRAEIDVLRAGLENAQRRIEQLENQVTEILSMKEPNT